MPIDETETPSAGRKFPGSCEKRLAYAAVASAVARPLSIMRFLPLRRERLRTDRRFVERLDYVAVGIANVERDRAVTMMLELMHDFDAGTPGPRVSRFDVCDSRHDKPEMVEALRVAAELAAM